MDENQNAMQNQPAQPSSPINWERLEALMSSVWEQSRETDRLMQETARRMQETDRQMQETSKRIAETDRIVKETSAQMKETDKRIEESRKETDRRMQETDRRIEESRKETHRLLDQMIKRVDKTSENIDKNEARISKQSDQFLAQSGHIVEGLMEPSVFKTLRRSGFAVTQCCREMAGSNPSAGVSMEVDLFYMNTVEAIAVEVKTCCTKAKINHFLKKMTNFKTIFHKYADMRIYVAMAAIKFTNEALEYAQKKGILIIRAQDDLFSILPFKKEKLKEF